MNGSPPLVILESGFAVPETHLTTPLNVVKIDDIRSRVSISIDRRSAHKRLKFVEDFSVRRVLPIQVLLKELRKSPTRVNFETHENLIQTVLKSLDDLPPNIWFAFQMKNQLLLPTHRKILSEFLSAIEYVSNLAQSDVPSGPISDTHGRLIDARKVTGNFDAEGRDPKMDSYVREIRSLLTMLKGSTIADLNPSLPKDIHTTDKVLNELLRKKPEGIICWIKVIDALLHDVNLFYLFVQTVFAGEGEVINYA